MNAIALKYFAKAVSEQELTLFSYRNARNSFLNYSAAKFWVPDWGDKVNSGIGLSYHPARIHRPVRQPYAGDDYIHQSGTMNLAIDLQSRFSSGLCASISGKFGWLFRVPPDVLQISPPPPPPTQTFTRWVLTNVQTWAQICKRLRSSGIDSTSLYGKAGKITLFLVPAASAGIFEQSIWARNRVGIGLSYPPARLYISWWNRFLGIDSCATFKNTVSGYIGWRNRVLGIDSWAP